MTDTNPALEFRPFARERDGARVIAYALDLFRISFGSEAPFVLQFGEDGLGYLAWLEAHQVAGPEGAAIVVLDGEPAGMAVVGSWAEDPSIGYVYHYYLVPQARGRGLAEALDRHAMSCLRRRGHHVARLSVAETNAPALGFYRKQGWRDVGPRPDQPGIRYFEKALRGP
jgi:ribosomal protein S18 acetylase RimI-like enzyme